MGSGIPVQAILWERGTHITEHTIVLDLSTERSGLCHMFDKEFNLSTKLTSCETGYTKYGTN